MILPYSAEFYVCFFCEKDFVSKECMRKHQKDCPWRPPDLNMSSSMCSDSASFSQPPPMSPKKISSTEYAQEWPRVSLKQMISALDLIAKHDSARLKHRKASTEVDCDILTDFAEPLSPVQQKTPTSLMSQLSRDESGSARKRLSYSLSVDRDREKIDVMNTSDESDSETESSKQTQQQAAARLNLLNIPVSSLLGQRIKKHIRIDSPVAVVSDSASFCRTPVKNNFLEKLRKKPVNYPIVYKPRRIANLHKQNHLYKFTKAQRKEFLSKANFGLSIESYKLFRQMKPLKIHVQKLSRKALLRWMSRRTLEKQLRVRFKGLKPRSMFENDGILPEKSEFPAGPSLLVQNIDKLLGLKRKSSQARNSLSLSHIVSEEMEEEVSKQKLTLYRSLLYEMSILKPTVVMEDIKNQQDEIEENDTKKSKEKKSVTDVKQAIVSSKEKSVFRTMLYHGKTERDAKLKKMNVSKEPVSKNNYKTLRSILTCKSSPEMPSPAVFSSAAGPSPQTDKSPHDDAFSILSVSSDNESLNSNCCHGCQEKKVSGNTPVKRGGKSYLEPLSVKVGDDISFNESNAFPSPLSVCSESLYNHTPVNTSDKGVPGGLTEQGSLTPVRSLKLPSEQSIPSQGQTINSKSDSKLIRTRSFSKSLKEKSPNRPAMPSLKLTQTINKDIQKVTRESSRKRSLSTEGSDVSLSKRPRFSTDLTPPASGSVKLLQKSNKISSDFSLRTTRSGSSHRTTGVNSPGKTYELQKVSESRNTNSAARTLFNNTKNIEHENKSTSTSPSKGVLKLKLSHSSPEISTLKKSPSKSPVKRERSMPTSEKITTRLVKKNEIHFTRSKSFSSSPSKSPKKWN